LHKNKLTTLAQHVIRCINYRFRSYLYRMQRVVVEDYEHAFKTFLRSIQLLQATLRFAAFPHIYLANSPTMEPEISTPLTPQLVTPTSVSPIAFHSY
jgi:hypothetical protein